METVEIETNETRNNKNGKWILRVVFGFELFATAKIHCHGHVRLEIRIRLKCRCAGNGMRMYDPSDGWNCASYSGQCVNFSAETECHKFVIIASGSEEPIEIYRFANETDTLRLISNSMKNCIGGDLDDDDATSWCPNVNAVRLQADTCTWISLQCRNFSKNYCRPENSRCCPPLCCAKLCRALSSSGRQVKYVNPEIVP